MQWRRRRRVLVVVGAAQRALLLRGLQLVTDADDERLEAAERRWLESPKVRAVRELIQRFQVADDEQDDGSEDEESRDEERGGRERHWKPRPRFHQHHQGQHGTYGTYGSSTSGQEKRTFNEDEYTRITTPRQDVLFKKGYLGRKRPTADPAGSNGLSNGASTNGSTNGDGTLHNGESLDADCGDGSDMMDEQAYYYPGAFVDPATGMYYVNGGYEMYDPYTGAVTVVVGPGPGMMGLPPMGLPPMEFFSPRLPPPPHGPPHGPPPHMAPMQSDYCYMHGRKRFSVDSQVSENCSGPSSESAGSGPPSGPPSSPQECDSAGLPSGPSPGPSPGPPPGPLPPMGPMPYPPHPHYMYPYMFGAPLYSLDGVSVQGGPPYGPVCDVNAVNKRRKKKRRRKRRRGGGTDDGSEESSSEDNQLEEGEGAGLSSLSSQSAEDSQATPTDSDAFPEFVPKAVDPATVAASTLNGDASVWEPSILTPPQTPTACVLTEHKESPVSVQPTEALEVSESASPITTCSAADELPAAEDATEQPKPTPSEATPTPSPEERPVEAPAPEETPAAEETPAKEPSSPSAVETVEKSAEPSPATEEAEETLPLADTAAEAHSTPSDTSAVIREATPVPVEEPQTLPEPVKEVEAIAKVKNGVKHSAPKVNGEVLCVSKKAVEQSTTPLVNGKDVLEFESSLTLPVEKVPVCNGEVICLQQAVESNPETVLSQSIDISGNSGKEKSVQRTETFDVIFNNNNDLKQKGKVNQNKNAVNEVTVNGDKIVTATNGKVKKVRNNSSPDHRESNGFAEKARLSESPSGDDVSEAAAERGEGDEQTTPAQTKSEPVSRTKEAKSAKRKSKKRAPAKTDLSSKAGGVNGVMASTPPPPGPSASDPAPKPAEGVPDDLGFSLRPEPSIAWGRKNETKVRPVDDVLLQALVGSVQSAPLSAETKVDIPMELETPAPTPVAPRLEAEAEAEPVLVAEPQTEPKGSRLTPSSAHRPNRAKKWRQKERAPTPGRELTASSSSLSSSDEADEGENVIFMSPLVATATTTTTAPAVEQAQAEQRESPLRITEAVTAWLRDHESEEVLVPAVEHAAVSDSESGTDDEEEDDDENAQQPKNAIGNPFRASSHSSTTSTTPAQGPGADVEERVASVDEPEAEAAWDTLCDPSLFVAKYYRLGEDPQDTMPAVVALELRPDLEVKHQRRIRSSMSPEKKGLSALCDQHDSGVHSDESGDEHHTPTKDKDMQAQAEEFAAKSAYLLRQLKGQSPGVPCGGICCSLQ